MKIEKNFGYLAKECGDRFPLQVMRSNAGHYIGTSQNGMPYTRESVEYYPTQSDAEDALRDGAWTQKQRL